MSISLTIFGRSLLLLVLGLLANAICWAVAAVLFARKTDTQPILSLALLSWTLGLRHALDADHISAIDNATRNLIGMGQLPVTCGLFFSLGHSTIVIVVTIAIAISVGVYDRLGGISDVGGIIGPAISGSFLFLVGVANSIILWRIVRARQRRAKAKVSGQEGPPADPKKESMLMMRIIGPVVSFVNHPWKMYPIGVLFGLGFDTASSIALISMSTIAKQRSEDRVNFPVSHIIILPFLFTAGMTFLDSVDSVIMLYSYTGFPERRWKLFERSVSPAPTLQVTVEPDAEKNQTSTEKSEALEVLPPANTETMNAVKAHAMSGLSILLTVMSIILAFSISLITIMSLIGERCSQCRESTEAEDGGGLAGRWWRGWAKAAEQSGWIGIGIVGMFIIVVGGWYLGKWVLQRRERQGERQEPSNTQSFA